MKIKNKKEMFCLFLIISLCLFSSLLIDFELEINKDKIQTNHKNPQTYQNLNNPNPSVTTSTEIVRPNADVENAGFTTVPSGGIIYSKIDDSVTSPSTGGDSDYIRAASSIVSGEVDLGTYSLSSRQKVIAIRIYARCRRSNDMTMNFEWRLGDGTYSSFKNMDPGQTSFNWQSTSSWSGLDLNQADLNVLRIRMVPEGMTGNIDISVLYMQLTVQTNEAPIVNIDHPVVGENLMGDTYNIKWTASDVEDALTLTYDIDYKNETTGTWTYIYSGDNGGSQEYPWDISGFISKESDVYLRIIASDPYGGSSDEVGPFTIHNSDPVVSITSPSVGETIEESHLITWDYSDPDVDIGTFSLYYNIDGGAWNPIVSDLVDQTSYLWGLSGFTQNETNVKINITASDGDGGMDDDISEIFNIFINSEPSVNITSPYGGEAIEDTHLITWDYSDPDEDSGNFSLYYNIDGGAWNPIVLDLFDQSSYLWDLSGFTQNETSVRINITASDGNGGFDENISAPFNIFVNSNPSITITSPEGGEIFESTCLITWDYSDLDGHLGNFSLYYNIDGGAWNPIVSDLFDQSSFLWDLSGFTQNETNVKINITVSDGNGGMDGNISASFNIFVNSNPSITITSPNGGENIEGTHLITWDYSDPDGHLGNFSLYYCINDGSWNSIVSGLFKQTSYLWNLSEFTLRETNVRIHIQVDDGYNGFANDSSDADFMIYINHEPIVYLITPQEEDFSVNSIIIRWQYSDSDGDSVTFNLYYNIGSEWHSIVSGLKDVNYYEWDLSEISENFDEITIRIQANDGQGGVVADINEDYSNYIELLSENTFSFKIIILITILIGSSVTIPLISYRIKVFKNKKKEKNLTESDIEETSENDMIPYSKNKAKIIIEGEMLLKKQDGISKSASVLNLLANNMNLLSEINGKGGYEVFKVLGQFNVTSLSDEFCEKVEKLEWKGTEKIDFINDMLSLTPEERNELLDGMINRFGTKIQAQEISEI